MIVTRRGAPLVRIEPVRNRKSKQRSIWGLRADYVKEHGPLTEDFCLPVRQKQDWRNPLEN